MRHDDESQQKILLISELCQSFIITGLSTIQINIKQLLTSRNRDLLSFKFRSRLGECDRKDTVLHRGIDLIVLSIKQSVYYSRILESRDTPLRLEEVARFLNIFQSDVLE